MILIVLAGATSISESERVAARKEISGLLAGGLLGLLMIPLLLLVLIDGGEISSRAEVEMASILTYAAADVAQLVSRFVSSSEAAAQLAPRLNLAKSGEFLWHSRILGLTLLLLPVSFSLWIVARIGRGRAHPSYRMSTQLNQGLRLEAAGAKESWRR